MFISKLITHNRDQSSKEAKTQITVKLFVDLLLDSVGWYAMGHYNRKHFLNAVIRQEKHLSSLFEPNEVQLAWVKIDDKSFELVDASTKGAQPITFIEYLEQVEEDW